MFIDNAIIMAAGLSSRFAPLSNKIPKALIKVKGEILIERQIKQLKEAGISRIIVVTGYKGDMLNYLRDRFDVTLVYNKEYAIRNNNGSIWAVRKYLGNSFVCSADNYFVINPFEAQADESYYASEYSAGYTKEWCMTEDAQGYINSVSIGGEKSWYMIGHSFWSGEFSNSFLHILSEIYELPETKNKLWEQIFIEHLDVLKMKIRKYDIGIIQEFDTLDELKIFDPESEYDI